MILVLTCEFHTTFKKTNYYRMKTKKIFSLVLTVLVLTSTLVMAESKKGNEKVTFEVNMHCEACQKKIEKNIVHEKGVKAMEVNLEKKTVALTYDAKRTDAGKLQAALVKLGYKASVSKGEKKCCSEGATGCKDVAAAPGECKDKAKDKACCSDKAKTGDKAGCKGDAGACKQSCGEKSATKKACCDTTKTAAAPKAGCSTAAAPKAGCSTAAAPKAGCSTAAAPQAVAAAKK